MKDDLKNQGYSKEDEYFYQKDRELIAKLRERAEANKAKVAENSRQEHWMRCPRCGSSLVEEKYADVVLVDRCSSKDCGGIFFDGGELEILMKAKSSLLKRIFGG
jgi:uncharacterized protein